MNLTEHFEVMRPRDDVVELLCHDETLLELLPQGDTKIIEVLHLLREKKYPIPANIEYEYEGQDTVVEVRKCFEYCKSALV